MLTIEQVKTLRHGQILHHVTQKNADGSPLRVRVNGKPQFWKTRPVDFRLPVKYGLYQYAQVTETDAEYWTLA
jgi:hypothetical protein